MQSAASGMTRHKFSVCPFGTVETDNKAKSEIKQNCTIERNSKIIKPQRESIQSCLRSDDSPSAPVPLALYKGSARGGCSQSASSGLTG